MINKRIASLAIIGCILFSLPIKAQQETTKKVEIEITTENDGDARHIIIDGLESEEISKLLEEKGFNDVEINSKDGRLEITLKTDEGEKELNFFNFSHSFNLHQPSGPFLGIVGHTAPEDAEISGVELKQVIKETAAEKAGLKVGDIITEYNGQEIDDYQVLVSAIRDNEEGDEVTIKAYRNGKMMEFKPILGKRKHHNSFFNKDFDLDFEIESQDIEDMKEHLKINMCHTTNGFLGVYYEENDGEGVNITKIVEESPAEEAGLAMEDVIKSINGKTISGKSSFLEIMKNTKPGDEVAVVIERDGKAITKNIVLDKNSNSYNYSWALGESHFFGDGGNHMKIKMRILEITDEEKDMVRKTIGINDPDSFENMNIDIYPNPTEGEFSLKLSDMDIEELEVIVLDNGGKRVFEDSMEAFSGQYEKEIDLTQQPKGIYFLVLKSGDKVYTEKIVRN